MPRNSNSLDDVEAGLRAAHQLIDQIARLTGVPYRPAWAQPLFDGWQQSMAWIAHRKSRETRIAALEGAIRDYKREHEAPARNYARLQSRRRLRDQLFALVE